MATRALSVAAAARPLRAAEQGWLAEYVACMFQFKRDAPWRRWQDASKEDRALAFEEELGREQRRGQRQSSSAWRHSLRFLELF